MLSAKLKKSLVMEEEDGHVPTIFLMGEKRSGKTSTAKVIFENMSPHETGSLESTKLINKYNINNSSYVSYEVWEIPSPPEYDDTADATMAEYFANIDVDFSQCDSIVFLIDAQVELFGALSMLHATIRHASKKNPKINFEIFIHKVDNLLEDMKIEVQQCIQQSVSDDLIDSGLLDIRLRFHLTSIFDSSVLVSLSKVIQILIPERSALVRLLNIFDKGSIIEMSFFFDLKSKIYLATDKEPVDIQRFDLCCNMIDAFLKLSNIYGCPEDESQCHGSDNESSFVIKLSDDQVFYMRIVDKYLALISIMKEENFKRTSVIEYNFLVMYKAFQQIFAVRGHIKEQQRLHDSGISPSVLSSSKLSNVSHNDIEAADNDDVDDDI